jgi:hypothetical protein
MRRRSAGGEPIKVRGRETPTSKRPEAAKAARVRGSPKPDQETTGRAAQARARRVAGAEEGNRRRTATKIRIDDT